MRLGLSTIAGLKSATAERIVAARAAAPGGQFVSVADLGQRAELSRAELDRLAGADALALLVGGHRRQAAWAASASDVVFVQHDLFAAATPEAGAGALGKAGSAGGAAGYGAPCFAAGADELIALPAPYEAENLIADHATLGLSLRRHPLSLLRHNLSHGDSLRSQKIRYSTAREITQAADRQLARAAGLVVGRQRPGTATGVVFVTLEDETGNINVVVWPQLVEAQRRELLGSRLLGVYGQVQREGEVVHLVARKLVDLSDWLGNLRVESRDFC